MLNVLITALRAHAHSLEYSSEPFAHYDHRHARWPFHFWRLIFTYCPRSYIIASVPLNRAENSARREHDCDTIRAEVTAHRIKE